MTFIFYHDNAYGTARTWFSDRQHCKCSNHSLLNFDTKLFVTRCSTSLNLVGSSSVWFTHNYVNASAIHVYDTGTTGNSTNRQFRGSLTGGGWSDIMCQFQRGCFERQKKKGGFWCELFQVLKPSRSDVECWNQSISVIKIIVIMFKQIPPVVLFVHILFRGLKKVVFRDLKKDTYVPTTPPETVQVRGHQLTVCIHNVLERDVYGTSCF